MAWLSNLFKNKQEQEKDDVYALMYEYFNEKKFAYTLEEPDVVKLNFTSRNNVLFELRFQYLSNIDGLNIYSTLPLWFRKEEEDRLISFVNRINYKADAPLLYESEGHTVTCRDLVMIDRTMLHKHTFETIFMRHYRMSCGWLGALEAFKNGELNEETLEETFINNTEL